MSSGSLTLLHRRLLAADVSLDELRDPSPGVPPTPTQELAALLGTALTESRLRAWLRVVGFAFALGMLALAVGLLATPQGGIGCDSPGLAWA